MQKNLRRAAILQKSMQGLAVCGFALAGLLSLFLWRDVVRSVHLAHMEEPQIKPVLEAPLVPGASARWLEAWSDQALASPDPSPQRLNKARRAVRQALRQRPAEIGLWNRLAYIDVLQHGALMPEGEAALRRSFVLSPYGGSKLMRWRLNLANALWLSLDEDIRQKCLSQIKALAVHKAEHKWLRHLARRTKREVIRKAIQQELDRN